MLIQSLRPGLHGRLSTMAALLALALFAPATARSQTRVPLQVYYGPGADNDIRYSLQGPHPEWKAPNPSARTLSARALIQGVNARAMALVKDGPHSTLVLTSARQGSVTALPLDTDTRPVQAGKPFTLATGIDNSMGVAHSTLRDELAFTSLGTLYAIADVRDLFRRLHTGEAPARPAPKTLHRALPNHRWHGGKYLRYTPDEQALLINIGAPCNTCLPEGLTATISRYDLKTGQIKPHVRGVRNSVGFDFDAQGRLWISSNGADNMGDNFPPDVLTWITPTQVEQAGAQGTEPHLGFPFCHAGLKEDPDFGKPGDCQRFAPTHLPQWAHSAVLGVRIVSPDQLPALKAYAEHARRQGAQAQTLQYALLAHHGSWNRSTPAGYLVSITPFDARGSYGTWRLIDGFLANQNGTLTVRGRPVDIVVPAPDQLLISDDAAATVHALSLD